MTLDIDHIIDNYSFENLNEQHDLSEFSCESDDLNDFLINDAMNQQNDNLNLTKLICCNDEIIGFFSLLTDTIELKKIRDDETKDSITNHYPKSKKVPAIKIGRLAICEKYSGNGLGSQILLNIIHNIRNLANNHVGLRFITVEGYVKAYTLYKRNNFIHFKQHDNDIKKIEKIKENNPEHSIFMYQDIKMISE